MKPIRRISPISEAKKKINAEYAKLKRVWWGYGRYCEFPGCTALAEKQPHHRHGRAGNLLFCVQLWSALCFNHHRWVHDNIEKARKLGLIADKGWWNRNPIERLSNEN